MKRLNIIALLLMSLLALFSCGDDKDNYLTLNEGDIAKPTLQVNIQDNFVINKDNLEEIAGTWQWTAANFGVNSEINYQILIDVNKEMSNPQNVVVYSSSLFGKPQEVTNALINEAVQSLLPEGVDPEDMEEMTFYLAVKAYLGTSGVLLPAISEPVAIKFTPFPNPKPKDILYVVGGGLVGWDNLVSSIGNHLQVLFAENSSGTNLKYTYTGYFKADGGLKFPTKAGDWDTAYGYEGGSLVPNNEGGDAPGPDKPGVYTLSVDLKELSVSLEAYEGELKTYETIGVVGDAVGSWDVDIEMTKVAEYVWVAKDVELAVGTIKFRANKSWDINWGHNAPDLPFGVGKQGEDNIPIEESGKYFLSLNSLTGHYIVIPMASLPVKP